MLHREPGPSSIPNWGSQQAHTFPCASRGLGCGEQGLGGLKRTSLLGVGGKGKAVHQGGGPSTSKLSDGDRRYEQKALFFMSFDVSKRQRETMSTE